MGEIKRLGGDINAVIVWLPERRAPGLVLQHDTITIIRDELRDIRTQLEQGDRAEAEFVIDMLDQQFSHYLDMFDNLGPGGWAALKPE